MVAWVAPVVGGWGTWFASWALGFPLVVTTIALHALGIGVINTSLKRFRGRKLPQRPELPVKMFSGGLEIIAAGLSLAVLHGIESGIWATVYLVTGASSNFAEAMLYSIDSMTTRGGWLQPLARQWAMLGSLESVAGMLVFGLSTAFLFVVLRRVDIGVSEHPS
jgi:hypothetical protein